MIRRLSPVVPGNDAFRIAREARNPAWNAPQLSLVIFAALVAPEAAAVAACASPAIAVSAAGDAAPSAAFVLRWRAAAPFADVPVPGAAAVVAAPAAAFGTACPAAAGICGRDQDCRCSARAAVVLQEAHWDGPQDDRHLRRPAVQLRGLREDYTALQLRAPGRLRGTLLVWR